MNVIELAPDQGIMLRDGDEVVVLSQGEILALLSRADGHTLNEVPPYAPTMHALRTANALQQLRKAGAQHHDNPVLTADILKAAQDEMILAFENSGGPKESPYLADQAYAVAASHRLTKLIRYLEAGH